MPEHRQTIPQPDNICARCTTIDLDGISRGSWPHSRYIGNKIILKLEQDDVWNTSCILCQLLKAVAPTGPSRGELHIVSRNLDETECRLILGDPRSSATLLSVGEDLTTYDMSAKFLCLQSDVSPTINILDSHSIDFKLLPRWLSLCLNNHDEHCSLETRPGISGLRVINVHTRRLEAAAENVRYTALSYVWGQSPKQTPNSSLDSSTTPAATSPEDTDKLPDSLPTTIKDAISVTDTLGFDYLWIDRYCVPQDEANAKEKHDQINRMDQIYRNAEVTIIAAAGEGPEHGLPGMGSTPRMAQPWARIGKHTLISTMMRPSQLVKNSRWSSRAWTYQEGMCSRRRLIFTDEQVFFECQGMSCRENMDYIWTADQYCIIQDYWDTKQRRIFPEAIWYHIRAYSTRQLSYDSDAMNALLGMFRRYQAAMNPAFHVWGVPIIPPGEGHGGEERTHKTLEESFLAGLTWSLAEAGKRRAAFPSWSWVGWKSDSLVVPPILWCDTTRSLGVTSLRLAARVSLGRKDGSFPPFERTFEDLIRTNRLESLSDSLLLSGHMLELHAKIFPSVSAEPASNGKPTLFAWPASAFEDLQLVAPVELTGAISMDAENLWRTEPRRLLGVMLQELDVLKTREMFTLVVSKLEDGTYERVGYIQIGVGLSYKAMEVRSISTGSQAHCSVAGIDEKLALQKGWVLGSKHGSIILR